MEKERRKEKGGKKMGSYQKRNRKKRWRERKTDCELVVLAAANYHR